MALLPQTQIQIPNLPIAGLIAGFDNQQLSSVSVVVGSNNKVLAPFSNITGNGNSVYDLRGSNHIQGSNNAIKGYDNTITGSENVVNGDNISISGTGNDISGKSISVKGDNNISIQDFQDIKSTTIHGNNNIIQSTTFMVGDNNQLGLGYTSSYVFGYNNVLQNTIVYQDDSGATESNPTQSVVAPYVPVIDKVYVYGDYNTISASVSNVFVVATNEVVSTSNEVLIGSDKNLNIKSKVLSCDLIQDFTPSGLNDQTGVDGWVTKDVDNVYVKTSIGWRILPFNNTYGSFYDTSTQSSLTASTPLAMTFDSTQVAKDVSIQNNSQITVDWDGVYNIQFSAVFEKQSSSAADIDIWFRYNGTNISYSNTKLTIAGSSKTVESWNYVYSMTASSYIEIMWASDNTGVEIVSIPAQQQPTIPETPSVILTVDKISSL